MVVFNLSYLLVLVYCGGGVLSTPLCLAGDFDTQLQHILRTQVVSAQDPARLIARVLDDVRATLSQRWQGFKLIPFGSLTSGLGTTSSDLDISVRLPNFNYSSSSYVLEETRQLFQKQPALYTYLNSLQTPKFTRYSFIHIPTQRKVDLVFHLYMYGEESVATSKLLRYYFNLDERNLTLARFLKYLFNIHGLVGPRGTLVSYTLYMLIIFYLQQKNMAPPVYVLQKDSKNEFEIFVDGWDVSFNELPYNTTNTENLHQLLGGFFKYYSEFNFEEYIVSPFTGRPISKSTFIEVGSHAQEHFLNNYFNHTIQLRISHNLNCTDLCIQAVFSLDANNGEVVSHEYATKFKHFMSSVAKMFEDLPSDSILRAILVVDRCKESINHNNATMDGIREQTFLLTHHHHISRKTSTAGHRPPPSVATTTGPMRLASIDYPRPSPGHRSILWEAFQHCVFRYAVATPELFGPIDHLFCEQCALPTATSV